MPNAYGTEFDLGENLTTEQMESLLRSARADYGIGSGQADVDGSASGDWAKDIEPSIPCVSDIGGGTAQEPFSTLGFNRNQTANYSPMESIPWPVCTTNHRSSFTHFLNLHHKVTDTGEYNGYTNNHKPFIARYDPAGGAPKIGHPLGVKPDNAGGVLNHHYPGFVCIYPPDTTNNLVWVMRAYDLSLYGEVVGAAIPDNTSGTIKLLSRDSSDIVDPDTELTPWLIGNVVNQTGSQLDVGAYVVAHPTLGGYVIGDQPPPPPTPAVQVEVVSDVSWDNANCKLQVEKKTITVQADGTPSTSDLLAFTKMNVMKNLYEYDDSGQGPDGVRYVYQEVGVACPGVTDTADPITYATCPQPQGPVNPQ